MKRPIACCLTTAVCILLVPAMTSATPKVGAKHNGYSICEEQALHLYMQGMKNGLDFGRNRIEDGKLLASGKVVPEPRPCAWRDKLDAMLHPPVVQAPVAVASPASIAPAPTTTVAPSSAGGCVGMSAESGSAGYGAMSSSGYIGCYQIGPEHYAAGGSCAGLGTDPAGQDACAANICATEGPGAWTNPAGQNPCGRLGG